ncbi:MAG TPA: tetratricopeptide repeat protein [Candidatus Angelobacter sp.]|nr:tetratricopeptide repeat protein [Candidatus Angelobacter sp.]
MKFVLGFAAGCLLLGLPSARGADLEDCRKWFITGNYSECIRVAEEAAPKERDEEWQILLMESLLATGRYPEAEAALTNALPRYRSEIRLRLVGCDVFNANGKPDEARRLLDEINDRGGSSRWMYRDPANLVALGKAALLLGAEPKLVLENFFDQAKKADPNLRDAYLASGDLALDKEDYALAAKIFGEALKKFPDDPDMHFGLAMAYAPSARPLMLKSLEATLSRNEHHVPAMLLLADHAIDAEDYDTAGETLDRALAVNPWQPDAWAYRAVLAHLRHDTNGESEARAKAMKFWPTNPRVDHLIGKKLSQKYRFAEGSACQRRALKYDAGYLPAKIQLAQDLLRLGQEEEGWELADEVHQRDGYDVTAYNLVTLRETFAKFQTVTNRDFVVRMSGHEAAIYGDRVRDLLQRAKDRLSDKYGLELDQPTAVEIFPEQKDFAVRTFGMPDNPGFLGVCFGHVVTANSPASQTSHPANWQAVLWHEFCHVITLGLTHNKMPRWLSEGISVYEEKQANPTWGQVMSPRYREMVLGDDLTPVSKLSAAFLSPKSDLHLQFAYYESSLVVEFLVQRFGFESLKQILHDLGEDADINQAIAAHTEPMGEFEKDFAAFARDRAQHLAPGLDFKKFKPVNPDSSAESLADLVDKYPTNFWVLTDFARRLVAEKKWMEAKVPLKKLIDEYPDCADANNGYALMAAAHRGLNETNEEREVLSKLASLDADATDAFSRLMVLGEAAGDWPSVVQNAERFLAVNPLLPQPYRHLARASEELGRTGAAIQAYQKLLLLDPPDPAEVHFRLARLLRKTGDPAAKRHVLQALEEAPRFREAHHLLLEIEAGTQGAKKSEPAVAAENKP